MARTVKRFGARAAMPPETRALADSSELGEKAVDRVQSSLAAEIVQLLEQQGTGTLTERSGEILLEQIASVYGNVYGASREQAASAQLTRVIADEAQRTRQRAARVHLRRVARVIARDPELMAAMGITRRELRELYGS